MNFKVRIRLANPSLTMLAKLESAMEQKKFHGVGGCLDAHDNYYIEYRYVSASRTEREVCALAHSIAEQVQKGPVVLVDKV